MQTAEHVIASLVAHGCLPMVAGLQPSGPPPQGNLLTPAERAREGFKEAGFTFRYAAEDSPVLADFGPQNATLRAEHVDAERALRALGLAIESVAADIVVREEPHPSDADRAQRIFLVRVSDRRYARVIVAFPRLGAHTRAGVEVKVAGMEAVGRRASAG